MTNNFTRVTPYIKYVTEVKYEIPSRKVYARNGPAMYFQNASMKALLAPSCYIYNN